MSVKNLTMADRVTMATLSRLGGNAKLSTIARELDVSKAAARQRMYRLRAHGLAKDRGKERWVICESLTPRQQVMAWVSTRAPDEFTADEVPVDIRFSQKRSILWDLCKNGTLITYVADGRNWYIKPEVSNVGQYEGLVHRALVDHPGATITKLVELTGASGGVVRRALSDIGAKRHRESVHGFFRYYLPDDPAPEQPKPEPAKQSPLSVGRIRAAIDERKAKVAALERELSTLTKAAEALESIADTVLELL